MEMELICEAKVHKLPISLEAKQLIDDAASSIQKSKGYPVNYSIEEVADTKSARLNCDISRMDSETKALFIRNFQRFIDTP